MSQQTKEALDRAVQEHYADEFGGAIVKHFVLQVSGGTLDDYDQERTSYLRVIADGMAGYEVIGLLDYALTVMRHNHVAGIGD